MVPDPFVKVYPSAATFAVSFWYRVEPNGSVLSIRQYAQGKKNWAYPSCQRPSTQMVLHLTRCQDQQQLRDGCWSPVHTHPRHLIWWRTCCRPGLRERSTWWEIWPPPGRCRCRSPWDDSGQNRPPWLWNRRQRGSSWQQDLWKEGERETYKGQRKRTPANFTPINTTTTTTYEQHSTRSFHFFYILTTCTRIHHFLANFKINYSHRPKQITPISLGVQHPFAHLLPFRGTCAQQTRIHCAWQDCNFLAAQTP